MTFALSINRNIIDKGKASMPGWVNASFSSQELATHIQNGFAYSGGAIKDPKLIDFKKPTIKDIEFAQLVCIDIDNSKRTKVNDKNETVKLTEAEGYISYNDVINDNFVKNNALLTHSTATSTDKWNKIRVVFLLDTKVNDATQFKEICLCLIDKFGAAADKSINNFERFFYGSTNCQYNIFNKILTLNTIDLIKQNAIAKKETYKEHSENNYDFTSNDIAELLKYVDGTSLARNEWIQIYNAVGNTLDFNTALSILENWSPDTEKGTAKILESTFKNPKKASIGSIVHFAKLGGCDFKSFMRERYNNNNSNVTTKSKKTNSNDTETKPTKQNNSSYDNRIVELNKLVENYLNDTYDLRENVIKHCIEFKLKNNDNFSEFLDNHFNSILVDFMKQGKNVPEKKLRIIIESDFTKKYNPFDWFKNLNPVVPVKYGETINGTPYEFDDYIEEIAMRVPIHDNYQQHWIKIFRKFMVGAVATATRYNEKASNHLCPILQGGQGVGKTTFTAMLTPPHLAEYTAPVDIRPQNKDGKIAISEMFMIILDEIETFDRNEQEHLKSLISSTKIQERRPYARTKETMPRTASFIASINKVEFLSDMTGTRRFPVFQVIDKIDTYTPIDYEKLYGTCLWYLQNNFEYWLNSAEIDEVNHNNQRFNALNIEEELLNQYLMPSQKDKPHSEFKTTTDIMKLLNNKMPSAKINMRTLGMALRRLGYEQVGKKDGNIPLKGYWVETMTDNIEYNKF